jgi:hypothetical protein
MVSGHHPQLVKIQGFLNCSAREGIICAVDPVMQAKINEDLEYNVKFLDDIAEGQYLNTIRYALTDSKISKYDLYTLQTVLYEPALGCYLLAIKSTDAYQDKYPITRKKLPLFHCAAFYEISDTKCRYVNISWFDLNMGRVVKILEKILFKTLLEKRAKMVNEGLVWACEEMRKTEFVPNKFDGDRTLMDNLDSFFKKHPEKEPGNNQSTLAEGTEI